MEESGYHGNLSRVFINSFVFAFFLLLFAGFIDSMGCIISASVMLFTFAFASIREAMYA